MNSEDKKIISNVNQAVSRCLGVNPVFEDNWIGKFTLNIDDKEINCELFEYALHIGDDSLRLMNFQDIDSPAGKCYLVDFHRANYNIRILRMPKPETNEMFFMLSKTINKEIQFTNHVLIEFIEE